jgi:nicotinamide phosphoribosyltransferase
MNKLFNTDYYKVTHHLQYPKGTQRVFSYAESRGGKFDFTLFFGLQGFLKQYLCGKFVTQKDIDEAESFYKAGFGFDYFNKAGWQYILDRHEGRLPIRIKAVNEGKIVPTKNVLLTIENTDENVPWITQFVETMLLRGIWYPTTVATVSKQFKNIVKKYADLTGCDVSPFQLCDFGGRSVSSHESAGIGGAAHLVNFLGTDTVEGVRYAMENYGADVCGFSVMATEHSTTVIYGRENELQAYEHFLNVAPDNAILSIVIDSYDTENAVKNLLGGKLKNKILARNGKTVFRPDSGDVTTVPVDVVKWLWEIFGGSVNEKGYRTLNPKVGVIQGDGVSLESLPLILENLTKEGFATSNLIFGMGGKLLQADVNRDTLKWAIKTSAAKVNDKWVDVWKDPVTDQGKISKKGRLKLIKNEQDQFETVPESAPGEDLLVEVFLNGEVVKEYKFDEIRENARL